MINIVKLLDNYSLFSLITALFTFLKFKEPFCCSITRCKSTKKGRYPYNQLFVHLINYIRKLTEPDVSRERRNIRFRHYFCLSDERGPTGSGNSTVSKT